MILASDYPFMDILGTMALFFLWMMWFWCLIVVLGDVFRRRDIGGWSKAAWTVLMILVPLLGVLVYLIAHGSGMADRNVQAAAAQQEAFDAHIKTVATGNGGSQGGAAAEIARAKELLDAGTIDQREYEQIKHKALA